jgi:Putative beta barrel porin-7 (BBP7)
MRIRFTAQLTAAVLLAGLGALRAQDPGAALEEPPPVRWYGGLGFQGMQRQGLVHSAPLGLIDNGVTTTTRGLTTFLVNGQDGTAAAEPGEQFPFNARIPGVGDTTRTTFPDTGIRPPAGSQPFGDLGAIHESTILGLQGTVGVELGDNAVELTGYRIKGPQRYTAYSAEQLPPGPPTTMTFVSIDRTALNRVFDFDNDNDAVINTVFPNAPQPGTPSTNRLNLPFVNPPAGFNGNNGLWLQADRVILASQNTLTNAELNYRFLGFNNLGGGFGVELLGGIRYIKMNDFYGIYTQDDPIATPTTVATYGVQTDNRIIAPQIGLVLREMIVPPVAAISFTMKGALGMNEEEKTVSLVRGDGFVGSYDNSHHTVAARVYEIGIAAEFNVTRFIHISAGYNAMWLRGVAEAEQQVDFDLSHTSGVANYRSNMFYHGPTAEFGISF